ncbi:hepatocellular carcinoma-associated antigen 59 [Toxoplasma gondii GAB2-2007-GAL-DOM2]|uniref:Hepatocellular carcinoma-associated antigen 59 n=9 Tax=Toxoplasma gondii TaxID=5811 RepID=B9QNU4_TOXGV|nr:hepatocellular carcinoma-associated antigen 59 [Toxoplasma gondii VEG]KFG30795.1 hepatocellular carcinoma-associated antigen 59 [Toxoplasma gondii GAB2-2007-GAL-DOM2]KFG34686.1 hepatocellular carcinoma-associated antigen 59 [Toxoplasma gondii p89]CEL74071.1 TPA: hypothetical protein BN1205_049150 [Toxoplasma gondii VEG]
MGRGRERDRRIEADRRRSREELSPSSGEEREGRRTFSSPSRTKRIKAEKNRRRREGSHSRSASRSSERHRKPRARTRSASSPEQERTPEDSRREPSSRSPPQKEEGHRQRLRSESPEDPHDRSSSSDAVTKPFSSSESSLPSSSPSSSSSSLPYSAGFLGFRRRGFDASLARLKAVHAEESTMYANAAEASASRQTSASAVESSAETEAGAQEAKGSPAGSGGEQADEEDEEAEEMKLVLKSMRDLQRTRQAQRRKGLDIVGTQEEQRADAEEEEEDDLAGYGLLERNFSTVNTTTGLTVDKHLEEFLRERMQLKETPGPAEEAAEEKQSSGGANELYRVPDRLQVADRSGEYREQLNWLTGLTEVHLPMTVKLKNIEATEKAKRALLKKGEPDAVDDDEDPDAIRRRAFGQRYTWYDPDRRPRARAGDDKAVQDFSQRARRAQQNRGRVGIGYG